MTPQDRIPTETQDTPKYDLEWCVLSYDANTDRPTSNWFATLRDANTFRQAAKAKSPKTRTVLVRRQSIWSVDL